MKFLSNLFRRRKEDHLSDALQEVRDRLVERVSPEIAAQAEARLLRRIAQGCSPSVAARLAITWAISADHGDSKL